MRFTYLAVATLLIPAVAAAKPLLGAHHVPPVFVDEPSAAVWLVSSNAGYGFTAFAPISEFASPGDWVRLDWKQNGKVLATVKCERRGTCVYGDKALKAAGAIDAELIYHAERDDKDYLVRTFKMNVKAWKELDNSTLWQIVPDDLPAAAWARHWHGPTPALDGRPQLVFWLAETTPNASGALRCTVDGQQQPDIAATLDDVEYSEQVVAEHTPPKGPTQHYHWQHIKLVPDIYFGVADGAPKAFLGDTPGKWDCMLRVESKVLRELLFTVDDKGMIVQDEMQSGAHPIPTVAGTVLIDVRIPKSATERFRPEAMKKSMGFGLPWPDHPKVKAIHAALPPASGLPDPQ